MRQKHININNLSKKAVQLMWVGLYLMIDNNSFSLYTLSSYLVKTTVFMNYCINQSKALQLYFIFCSYNQQQPAFQSLMNIQHNNKMVKRQNSISIRGKIGSFKQSIRQKYIESTINVLREQLLVAYKKDKPFKKTVDLQQCFNTINKIEDITNEYKQLDQAILDIFRYQDLCHAYSMMSDFLIQKLLKMVQWKNVGQFQPIPKAYIRIHKIIANYCNYACGAPEIYFDIIEQILKNILKQPNFYEQTMDCLFFTHTQTKELISVIFYGLGEIQYEKIDNLGLFIGRHQDLAKIILNETNKVFRYLQKHKWDQNNTATTIMMCSFKIFQHFLSLDITNSSNNEENSHQIQKIKIIESLDIKIVDKLLQILKVIKNHSKQLQYLIVECLIAYFQTNLQQKPQILLQHDFRIVLECFKDAASNVKKIHNQIMNYHKRLQIEGEKYISLIHLGDKVKDQERILSKWLYLLVIVFGVNLPEDQIDIQYTQKRYKLDNVKSRKLEQTYYELWTDWLQNYIISEFKQILKINKFKSKELMRKIMCILQNICLDQALCQILIEQPQISNFIFYNCHSQQVKIDIKKSSLMCLVNMLKVAYGDCLKKMLLSQAEKHNFSTIFADNLGVYSSPEINQKILEGLSKLLELDPCQSKIQNRYWRLFCESGGKRQLEKILEFKEQNWQNTVKFAEGILQQYDVHEV